MLIGDKTENGIIFDIQEDTVFECQTEDFTGNGLLVDWQTAMTKSTEGWRLPTQDELNLMYNNLAQNKLGNFEQSIYWSSTENNARSARVQNFLNGNQLDHYGKDVKLFVRLVREYKVEISQEERAEHVKHRSSIIEDTGEIFVGDVLSENFYKVVKNKKSILKTAIKEVEDIYYKWFNKKHVAPNAEQLHIMQKMFNLIQELKNQIEETQK